MPVLILALVTVAVHLLTGGQYGFHRDELATLDDARHLAWGYVAYPPVTPFFGRLSLLLFGTSLAGFRFFAAVAEAGALVLTGLIAKEMGGGRRAQFMAALAGVPFCLGGGALMQYVSFDYFCWVLTAYFVVRLLKTEDPRWWVAVGGTVGLGLMAKYSMAFFAVSIVGAMLLTPARKLLRNRWLVAGAALALLVVLPNLIWQAQHGFVSLEFLQTIHARDVRIGRAAGFLPDQLKMTLFGLPVALAGLWFCFRGRWRAVGWMYVIPLVIFMAAKARGYYLAAAYPMLYAAGSVWMERKQWVWKGLAWAGLCVNVFVAAAVVLPLAPVRSAWGQAAFRINGDFAEEIGWEDLVETVGQIWAAMPPHTAILARNYGEAGAINLYGPARGLPEAMSGVNSFWQRGYGNPPPEQLIVLGMDAESVERDFDGCRVAGRVWNRLAVANEETTGHPDVFVCRGPRKAWPEFWKEFRHFG